MWHLEGLLKIRAQKSFSTTKKQLGSNPLSKSCKRHVSNVLSIHYFFKHLCIYFYINFNFQDSLLLPFPKGHLKPIYWKNDYVLITKQVFWIFIRRKKRRRETFIFSLFFPRKRKVSIKKHYHSLRKQKLILANMSSAWLKMRKKWILPPTETHHSLRQKSTKIALPFSKHFPIT